MVWHLHLRAEVGLDLVDGRTVPTTPPAQSHEWTLPSGRKASVAIGDPSPGPGAETQLVRVTGPYLTVTHDPRSAGPFLIRVGQGPNRSHEYRTKSGDAGRLAQALHDALNRAISDQPKSEPQAMGYSVASWAAHERAWLRIVGR